MPVEGVDGYPLYWPEGWKRTEAHRRTSGRYDVTFARARDEVLRSLKLLGVGAGDVVISSGIPLRRDGLPYAGGSEPKDPGVAVYWLELGEWDSRLTRYHKTPRVMACDCWRTVRDNLRAVGLSLEALRALKRAGATQVLERAFAGFAALPSDTRPTPWRVILGVPDGSPVSRDAIERRYRLLAVDVHPDRGGTHERMIQLNRAREEALREVSA